MDILPAIDIKDGNVVRLVQGDFSRATEYSSDAAGVAKYFADCGAQWLHIVDLDGARTGQAHHLAEIERIGNATHAQLQVSGGVRDYHHIEALIGAGANRIVIGTAALCNEHWVHDVVFKYGSKIVISADARDEFVAAEAWSVQTSVHILAFVRTHQDVERIIYTDIRSDGTLHGPNFEMINRLLPLVPHLFVAGGISTLEEIRKLKSMGVEGCIIGKAFYEGVLSVEDALGAARAL